MSEVPSFYREAVTFKCQQVRTSRHSRWHLVMGAEVKRSRCHTLQAHPRNKMMAVYQEATKINCEFCHRFTTWDVRKLLADHLNIVQWPCPPEDLRVLADKMEELGALKDRRLVMVVLAWHI